MKRLFKDYGMLLVLAGLCVLFSVLTLKEQSTDGGEAVAAMLIQVDGDFSKDDIILTVGAENKGSGTFAETLGAKLKDDGYLASRTVVGDPRDLRLALDEIKNNGEELAAIVTTGDVVKWRVLEQLEGNFPEFSGYRLLVPESQVWPDFLKRGNLLAIVDRIVVIAIIAIGMTMVIVTSGIDLSVGCFICIGDLI